MPADLDIFIQRRLVTIVIGDILEPHEVPSCISRLRGRAGVTIS